MINTIIRRWKMKKFLMIFVCVILSSFTMGTVLGADAHIFTDTSDNVLLTIGTTGDGNFTGDVMENSIKLSETYLALAGGIVTGQTNFTDNLNVSGDFGVGGILYGDGSGLTGVTVTLSDNSTQLAYQNITNLPTCSDGQSFTFDGSSLTCGNPLVNGTIIAYQNVTGIPTCDAGDMLTFDGSTLTCDTPASTMDYTNLALINQTNDFIPQQTFTGGLVSNENVTIADTKGIEWVGGSGAIISASSGVITYKAGV